MDRNPAADEEDTGSVPGPGRFRELWADWACEPQSRSPHPGTCAAQAGEAPPREAERGREEPGQPKREIQFNCKNPLPASRAQIISLRFLEVLHFWFLCSGLWSISKLLLCVMRGRGGGLYFYVCLSIFILKTFLLPKIHRAHFLKNQLAIHTWIFFLGSLFCSTDLDICSYTSSILLHRRS